MLVDSDAFDAAGTISVLGVAPVFWTVVAKPVFRVPAASAFTTTFCLLFFAEVVKSVAGCNALDHGFPTAV